MDLQENFVGNPHCERAKLASIAGMTLDAVDNQSKTLQGATSIADTLQAYNLMRCVGKTPNQILNLYLKFVAGCIVSTIVIYLLIPQSWFTKCKICKNGECVENTGDKCQPWIGKLLVAFVPTIIVALIVHQVYVFSLKTRVFETLGLVGTSLIRSAT